MTPEKPAETPKDKTPDPATIALAVEKITAARAQGDQCYGMVMGRDMAEMKAVFHAAAEKLGLPVVALGALKGGTTADIQKYLGANMMAFRQAARAPALIVNDTSGNEAAKISARQSSEISNFVQGLSVQFPKAVYVQLIAEPHYGPTPQVNMYCMNPATPRDPKNPIYPV